MSDEKKETIEEAMQVKAITVEQPVTKQSLEAVPYHHLEETFKILRVEEAWKPGVKRIDMIKRALELLGVKKGLENKGVAEENIDTEAQKIVAKADAEKLVESATGLVEKIKAEEGSYEAEKNRILALHLTKEEVQRNLESIQKSLSNGILPHRSILITKQKILLEIQDSGEYPEKPVEDVVEE